MKFKAAILTETKQKLVIEEINCNKLLRGQVLVKISQTGICRSQIFEIDGQRGPDKWLPHLLGHEAIGEVVEIGPEVSKVKVGNQVILSWIKSKGIEAEPAKYKWGDKVVNGGRITTFSEYTIVSENRCVNLEGELSQGIGASLGCAIATGYGITLTLDDIQKAKNIGIVGLGGIGMSVLLGIIQETNANSIAIDINEERLKEAKILGATFSIKPQLTKDLKKELLKITGELMDVIIECTGTINGLESSLSLIKNNGIVKFISHPKTGEILKIDPYELILGKRIEGSWGGGVDPESHFHLIAKKVEGNLNFKKFYTNKKYSLDEINRAINDLRVGETLRPIISFEEN